MSRSKQAMYETSPAKTIAIFTSWMVISTIGALLIHDAWMSRGMPILAATRPPVFVAVMACVHIFGYWIYEKQHDRIEWFSIQLSPKYSSALRAAAIQQLILLIGSLLVLDLGQVFHGCLVSVLSFCLIAAVVVLRRPSTPTRLDLILLKYGSVPIFFAVQVLGQAVWSMLGLR